MNELLTIKKNLEENIGKEIHLRFNRGRRKDDTTKGVLEKTYQSIFVIRLADKIISFSYADLLTKSIEIVFDETKKVSNE